MFESKRKQVVVEPEPVGPTVPPHVSLELRDEVDPDPFIEEMVARLRDGLGSLTAFDEWGRPMSWRNVVRLAVGPMVSALRDAQTASEIAVTLMPDATQPATVNAAVTAAPAAAEVAPAAGIQVAPPVAPAVADVPDVQGHLVGWPAKAHQSWEPLPDPAPVLEAAPVEAPAEPVAEAVATEPPAEPVAADAEADEPATVEREDVEAVQAVVTVEADAVEGIQTDASEIVVEQRPTPPPTPVLGRRTFGAPNPQSIFTPHSADKGAVSLSPFGTGQPRGQGGTPEPTSVQYDRFLSGLYGQKQQDRRDG